MLARSQSTLFKITCIGKDLQTVNVTLRVLYQPKFEKLPHIFKSLGMDYDERVLPSIGNETMKAVFVSYFCVFNFFSHKHIQASYNAEELITQREAVSVEIRKMIQQEGDKYNIQFVDISIVSVHNVLLGICCLRLTLHSRRTCNLAKSSHKQSSTSKLHNRRRRSSVLLSKWLNSRSKQPLFAHRVRVNQPF